MLSRKDLRMIVVYSAQSGTHIHVYVACIQAYSQILSKPIRTCWHCALPNLAHESMDSEAELLVGKRLLSRRFADTYSKTVLVHVHTYMLIRLLCRYTAILACTYKLAPRHVLD